MKRHPPHSAAVGRDLPGLLYCSARSAPRHRRPTPPASAGTGKARCVASSTQRRGASSSRSTRRSFRSCSSPARLCPPCFQFPCRVGRGLALARRSARKATHPLGRFEGIVSKPLTKTHAERRLAEGRCKSASTSFAPAKVVVQGIGTISMAQPKACKAPLSRIFPRYVLGSP